MTDEPKATADELLDTKVTTIEQKIDPERLGAIAVEPELGNIALSDIRDVMEIAKMMAVSNFLVPKHLRGQQGACFGVCMYALEWKFSPFAVANKSYVVNDRLAFESQLLHAVIEARAPIRGRLRHEFEGEGEERRCKVWATPRGETAPLEWTSMPVGQIKIKNSPEWKNNPDKQLYYHASRDFCRVYFPDVIMGVYTAEEMEYSEPVDVTPEPTPNLLERLPGRTAGDGFQPDTVELAAEEQAALAKAEAQKEARKAQKAPRRTSVAASRTRRKAGRVATRPTEAKAAPEAQEA
jgi:hypothetical protein